MRFFMNIQRSLITRYPIQMTNPIAILSYSRRIITKIKVNIISPIAHQSGLVICQKGFSYHGEPFILGMLTDGSDNGSLTICDNPLEVSVRTFCSFIFSENNLWTSFQFRELLLSHANQTCGSGPSAGILTDSPRPKRRWLTIVPLELWSVMI